MSSLYISEYDEVGIMQPSGNRPPFPIPVEPALTTQKVTFSTEAKSAAFNANTRYVRLQADAVCHVAFGASPTADTSAQPLNANQEYHFAVTPAHKVSAIAQ